MKTNSAAACSRRWRKRPVETQEVERAIRKLVRQVRTLEDAEISSQQIGDWVAGELSRLDQVAYVRFASVYRRFEDVQAFREEIDAWNASTQGP
jgi:transcriptional repressor NrdR